MSGKCARADAYGNEAEEVYSMLVPSDDPNLSNYDGTAAASPFVLAAAAAGIKVNFRAAITVFALTDATAGHSKHNQCSLDHQRLLVK